MQYWIIWSWLFRGNLSSGDILAIYCWSAVGNMLQNQEDVQNVNVQLPICFVYWPRTVHGRTPTLRRTPKIINFLDVDRFSKREIRFIVHHKLNKMTSYSSIVGANCTTTHLVFIRWSQNTNTKKSAHHQLSYFCNKSVKSPTNQVGN